MGFGGEAGLAGDLISLVAVDNDDFDGCDESIEKRYLAPTDD